MGISPAISSKSVDFPQPDGPTIAANSPGKRSKRMSLNAGVSPLFVW